MKPEDPETRETLAVTLRYAEDDVAPRVTALGRGALAEEMLALARELNIPIQENPVLLASLARLNIDEAIPEALYRTVAEVIAFAWHLTGKRPGNEQQPSREEE